MKDITVSGKRIKTELYTLLSCFVIANLLNVYAIFAYNTHFSELFTVLGYISIFTVALYLCWTLLRVLFVILKKILKSKKIQS